MAPKIGNSGRKVCGCLLDRVAVEGNSDSDRPCSQTLDVKRNAPAKKGGGGGGVRGDGEGKTTVALGTAEKSKARTNEIPTAVLRDRIGLEQIKS